MVTEKRLFIVSNSTHYLNLINYIETKGKAQDFLILILKNSVDDNILLEQVKENSKCKVIKIIKYDINAHFPFHYFHLFSLVKKIKELKKIGNGFHTVIFNNYDSWIQQFIVRQFKTSKIELMSDGTGIFDTIDLRKKSITQYRFSANKWFVKNILQLSPIQNLKFYSPVAVDVADHDSIEIFDFQSSKASDIDVKKIFFVGSPLVEKNYLTLSAHLRNLEEIKNKFPGHDIYYLSHRGEAVENLASYSDFGQVVPYSLPFEERLEKSKELPGTIISYLSSILINLPQVYPQLYFFYFPISSEDIPKDSSFGIRYSELIRNFKKIKNSNLRVLS